jgi:hypothetical protein
MSEQQTMSISPSAVTPVTADAPIAGVVDKSIASLTLIEALKWVFSFPTMLGTLLVGLVAYQLRGFAIDPDVWWHIKDGQTIVATHHWPTVDPYSFTVAGAPWLAYELQNLVYKC